MKKRILLLGAGGMVGHVATVKLRQFYDVVAVSRTDNPAKPDVCMDVARFDLLEELILAKRPDVIINCVGVLNQQAEAAPANAILINGYLPHFLEQITRNTACKVIHISTDCVFSGARGNYIETDLKDGYGFYAQSKAIGEIVNEKDLTFRTSLIGPEIKSGIGLFHWFARQRGTVNGYTRVFWTGVTSIEMCNAIQAAIEENLCGLYHLVNNTKTTKFDLLMLFKTRFPLIEVDHVLPDSAKAYDKSLINTRHDFQHAVSSYEVMLEQMQQWMMDNRVLYGQYSKILQ